MAAEDGEGRFSRRGNEALVALAALTVFGFLARPLVLGEVFTASDLGNFYLPIRDFYAKALAAGHQVTWFPYEFTGFYLHGEGQLGLLHPLNLLQYHVLPLGAALNVELLRGYFALFAGVYVLARRFALPRDASLFGAFVATFSSFTLLHYMHLNIVGAAAHLPWLLCAMRMTFAARSPIEGPIGALGIVLLTASLCMLGHPQFVFMTTAIEVFVLFCAWLASRHAEDSPVLVAGARMGAWSGAKLLGFAAAGAALVPTLESLATSFRASPSAGFTSDFAIAPLALVQLVSPYLLADRAPHENLTEIGLYLGSVPTVLIVYAALRGKFEPRWPIVRAALALAALAFMLSLGDWGLIYRLQAWIPVVGLFRAPARYVLALELAAAVVAAIALAGLARNGRTLPRLSTVRAVALFLPAMVGVATVAAAPLLVGSLTSDASNVTLSDLWLQRWFGPAALALAALLVLLASRGTRLAVPALLLLATLDIATYGLSFVARSDPQTIDAFLARYRVPEHPGDDRLHWGPPALTMKGFRLAGGYVAMTPDRVLDLGPFGEPLRNVDDRLANALRVSGVRWAIGTHLAEPLPRFRLVSNARVTDDANRDIGSVDVRATVLVDEPVVLDAGPPGRVDVALDVPGEMELLTNAPGRRLLVVSERYHEGWRAEVDGAPCAVRRAYGDYMACIVGPGRQRVVFRFEPTSLRIGSQVSFAALGLTLAWLGVWSAAISARARD